MATKSIGQQIIQNLPRVPSKAARQEAGDASKNPITLLASLTPMQWAMFFSGWLAWISDALDFFAVSLAVPKLVEEFDRPTSKITQSITLTLLFRPIGAIVFGLASDRYGRKWPLTINLLIVAALSLSTAYCKSFSPFLAVRSLFGIGMGGIWGLATATSLENMPVEARGLFSGILQQGYAFGYLVAAVINLTAVPKHSWQALFHAAAGFSLGAAVIRVLLPESQYFLDRRRAEQEQGTRLNGSAKSKIFLQSAWMALKLHWVRCIYAILLMSGFNFFSHGSQDLYPTYLQKGKGLSAHASTVATIIGNCGAIAGGTIAGYVSQYLGRRITIIVCCIWTCCWIPLWLIPNEFGPLAAGAFFVQSGVQGAWGVVPVYLTEISPVAFRAVWPGVAYQIGNMVSASSSQIESTAGQNIKTAAGLPDYGKVSAILIGVVAAWIIFWTLLGSEAHGARFEQGKAAFEEGGGDDVAHADQPHPQDVEKDLASEKSISDRKQVLVEERYAK